MANLQSVAGRESESVDNSRGRETAEMVKMVDDEQDAASAERHSAAAAGASAGMKLGIVRLGRAGGKVRHAATWTLQCLACLDVT